MAGFVECLDNEDAEELINPDEGMLKVSYMTCTYLLRRIKLMKEGAFKSKNLLCVVFCRDTPLTKGKASMSC